VVHEADAERLRRVEAPRGVDQLLGHADADGAGQALRAAHVGHDAELDFGSEKSVPSAAMRISQQSASSMPAPMHTRWMAAITGTRTRSRR
jgi:hypothetical protein